jgi:hypothetical protein
MGGGIVILRGKTYGNIILLFVGILGVVGTFIPIHFYDTGWGSIYITYLCTTAMYIDLVLIIVGGVLGFAVKESR